MFWLHFKECGNLIPQPGIEPTPLAVEVWSPSHWTIQEVPGANFQVYSMADL